MKNETGQPLEAYTTYTVMYETTLKARKGRAGQHSWGVERTDGQAKLTGPRGYKVVLVRGKVGQ